MSGTMKPRASVAIAAVVSALVLVSIGGAAPPGTQTQAAEVAACAALYGVPAAAAPDPLASCQWDMRGDRGDAVPARTQLNLGAGRSRRRHGHRDRPRPTPTSCRTSMSLPRACSSTRPRRRLIPAEQVTRGRLLEQGRPAGPRRARDAHGRDDGRADQRHRDLGGGPQGDDRGAEGRDGRMGYFFTQSVVDALRYAGDQRLDVVNMSFFADPWLFNCRNDQEQKAIVQAISEAARYARAAGGRAGRGRRQRGDRPEPPDPATRSSRDFPPGAASLAAGQQQLRGPADRDPGCGGRHGDGSGEPAVRGSRRTGTSPT